MGPGNLTNQPLCLLYYLLFLLGVTPEYTVPAVSGQNKKSLTALGRFNVILTAEQRDA